jgi:hypothetical protein
VRADLLDDFYMWSPATRAWTNVYQEGGVVENCTVSSINDFSCSFYSRCLLLCGSGSVGRLAAPYQYNSNEAMAWIIGLESSNISETIRLSFTNFDTEGGYDYVRVYSCSSLACDSNSTLLGSFSGNQLPSDLTSSTGLMKIEWTSDQVVQYTGWRAVWTTRSARTEPSARRRLQATSVRPSARQGHGLAQFQDRLYLFGGLGSAGKLDCKCSEY